MTTSEFVRNLYDTCGNGPEGMTVNDAAEDIRNYRAEDWDLPEDITPEEYAEVWNRCCAEDLAERMNRYGWNEDFCERLCDLAGMLAEYNDATDDTYESVVRQAAEKLGVEIE